MLFLRRLETWPYFCSFFFKIGSSFRLLGMIDPASRKVSCKLYGYWLYPEKGQITHTNFNSMARAARTIPGTLGVPPSSLISSSCKYLWSSRDTKKTEPPPPSDGALLRNNDFLAIRIPAGHVLLTSRSIQQHKSTKSTRNSSGFR